MSLQPLHDGPPAEQCEWTDPEPYDATNYIAASDRRWVLLRADNHAQAARKARDWGRRQRALNAVCVLPSGKSGIEIRVFHEDPQGDVDFERMLSIPL